MYNPYMTLGYSDEIRIFINKICTCYAVWIVKFSCRRKSDNKKKKNENTPMLGGNCVAFMMKFDTNSMV